MHVKVDFGAVCLHGYGVESGWHYVGQLLEGPHPQRRARTHELGREIVMVYRIQPRNLPTPKLITADSATFLNVDWR